MLPIKQVPCPFAINSNQTYVEEGAVGKYDKVCVASPGAGLEKRQATLQICFSPCGNVIRIDIVFRGEGNVSQAEKDRYDKDVDVYFQK